MGDIYLTEHCGILKNLLPGDVVFADHGFTIAESVAAMHAKLYILAFTKGKSHLSALEVNDTRKITKATNCRFLAQGRSQNFFEGSLDLK